MTEGVDDATYFNYYARLGIHREMLDDEQRVATYRNAIRASVAGKVVCFTN